MNKDKNQEEIMSFADIAKELNLDSKQVEHSFNSAMYKLKKECFKQGMELEDFWLESIARSRAESFEMNDNSNNNMRGE